MLIGLSGYAQTGKDSTAEVLVTKHGFTRIAFADKLREALYNLNPVVGYRWRGLRREPVLYADLIDALGYEGARKTKYAPEIRRLLQRLGTEVGRNMFGENFWVEQALKDVSPNHSRENFVVTDCRFLNEARAVAQRGGEVWRISRPGVGPANDHISEVGLDDWPFDRSISNEGTLDVLADKVSNALGRARLRFAPDIPVASL